MEALTAIDVVRKRPGMYVGDVDRDGVLHMVLDLVANAYDQHLAGKCSKLALTVAADGSLTVEDDGPGIEVHGNGALPPIVQLLTTLSRTPTVDGHRPHVHLGLGGLGLVVVNALSERFELSSVRDGVEARIAYARGVLREPLHMAPATRASGTIVRCTPDATIFGHARVSRTALARELEDLAFLAPGLTLRWSIEGDAAAAAGLAGRVALHAACTADQVARSQASYDTDAGPIDVDVALAWRTGAGRDDDQPMIDSFVNLKRTRGDGRHVDGLHDGIRAFLGMPTVAHAPGLVAAVSVVLADVKYGNPTRDRLDSPQAQAPVATATRAALERWATTWPELAGALRGRARTA